MGKKRGFKSIIRLVAIFAIIALITGGELYAQETGFNGLNMGLGNLSRLSNAQTRSISPENFTGEKGKGGMAKIGEGSASGAARDLGQGWKVNPYIGVPAGEMLLMADIKGSGAIQHIWLTPSGTAVTRFCILRIYWDGETEPSVECPLGDFFANGWGGEFRQVDSLPVCVNPGSAYNCYWEMPFRKSCKITLTNINDKPMHIYFQIDYTLTDVPEDAAYFHAQFRRSKPLAYKQDHVILDGVKGKGHYVGTHMCWQSNNSGWWGEGEIKFFMDGDKEFPTICGTGTEDYFCGSYGFVNAAKTGYQEYSTAYAGMPQVYTPDGFNKSQMRFGLYRWHIMDPVRFESDLKVTMQALGWRSSGRYLPLQDDISSVAYWYQTEPHAQFPALPDKDTLEIN